MADYLIQGHCRCLENPVRFEFNKQPAEVHYCLCTHPMLNRPDDGLPRH